MVFDVPLSLLIESLFTAVAILMHRKVTAVELAGIEGFTHVVNDGVGLASFPVVILSAILPHAWAHFISNAEATCN